MTFTELQAPLLVNGLSFDILCIIYMSNTTDVTYIAGSALPSGAHEITPGLY